MESLHSLFMKGVLYIHGFGSVIWPFAAVGGRNTEINTDCLLSDVNPSQQVYHNNIRPCDLGGRRKY